MYAGCDAALVTVAFAIVGAAIGLNSASTMINANDLSPNYAGTIMAIANGVSSLAGFAVPTIIGFLTPNVI